MQPMSAAKSMPQLVMPRLPWASVMAISKAQREFFASYVAETYSTASVL